MTTTRPPVVFVHGLWMTALSWNEWAGHVEALGYRAYVPEWPRMDRSIEELRADPSIVAGLGVGEVVDHFAAFLDALGEPAILIGHSVGGLVVQLLLDRGYGVAGVAVHPGQTRGVWGLPPVQLRAAFPAIGNPLNWSRAVSLTPEQFHFGFANALSAQASGEAWRRLHVPAPAKPLFQIALANWSRTKTTVVDYRKPERAPLLFLSGGADRIVPASVVRENAKRYRSGVVELVEYPGRSHFTVGEPGWEQVLDHALGWTRARLA